ncbi:MAG: LLM class flavin-dependent oxidoreductase [Rhizorhabdus sp.]
MTIRIYWQLDVTADPHRSEASLRAQGHGVARDVRSGAFNRYDHYAQIARAVAITGFDGLFIRHREAGDDSQIVASALARETRGLYLIPEFPASVGSAVYAAKQAVSLQRASHGRLGWAIAPDVDAQARARNADPVGEDDLIARTEEFLTVARGVHGAVPFSYQGRFFEVERGGFAEPLNRVAFPPVFLRGASEEALALSARQADVHLFEAAPAHALRPHIEMLDTLAAHASRQVGFGILQPVVARDTADEAAEVATVEPGAIVGSHEQVAGGLAALAALGVNHFVLTGSPSLEEAYRIGEFVLPHLRDSVARRRAAA